MFYLWMTECHVCLLKETDYAFLRLERWTVCGIFLLMEDIEECARWFEMLMVNKIYFKNHIKLKESKRGVAFSSMHPRVICIVSRNQHFDFYLWHTNIYIYVCECLLCVCILISFIRIIFLCTFHFFRSICFVQLISTQCRFAYAVRRAVQSEVTKQEIAKKKRTAIEIYGSFYQFGWTPLLPFFLGYRTYIILLLVLFKTRVCLNSSDTYAEPLFIGCSIMCEYKLGFVECDFGFRRRKLGLRRLWFFVSLYRVFCGTRNK